MSIHHPTRGGTRGGQDQFKWDSIVTDKHRACYLGSSLHALPKFLQGRDQQWYAKSQESRNDIRHVQETDVEREKRLIKEKEAELMQMTLKHGFGAQRKQISSESEVKRVLQSDLSQDSATASQNEQSTGLGFKKEQKNTTLQTHERAIVQFGQSKKLKENKEKDEARNALAVHERKRNRSKSPVREPHFDQRNRNHRPYREPTLRDASRSPNRYDRNEYESKRRNSRRDRDKMDKYK